MPNLIHAVRSTKIEESLINYTLGDQGIDGASIASSGVDYDINNTYQIGEEWQFWNPVLDDYNYFRDKTIEINADVVLSEWVALVPGLFYKAGSDALRNVRKSNIEYVNKNWTHYTPLGKSRKVMGGIGTLKFPADKDGYRLVSLAMNQNASSGIPALIHPEIWEYYKMREGLKINKIVAPLRDMPSEWSLKFASTRGIPKACLFINKIEQIETNNEDAHVRHHPFTIMKYEKDGAEYFDFVFVNIDSDQKDARKNVQIFLGEYIYNDGRFGQYLIEPDISNPIIGSQDIICQSPLELRTKMEDSNAYLDLIQHRIHDTTFNDQTLDEIKHLLDHLNEKTLKRYAKNIGLNPNTVFRTGVSHASNTANLLDICMDRKMMTQFLDEVIEEYPEKFNN